MLDLKNFMRENPALLNGNKKPAEERPEITKLIMGNLECIGGYEDNRHLASLFTANGYAISVQSIREYRRGTIAPPYSRYDNFIDTVIDHTKQTYALSGTSEDNDPSPNA